MLDDLDADLTVLPLEQKLEIAPLLFEIAPGADAATVWKRKWIAYRLALPRKRVNRALWAAGCRWIPPEHKLHWAHRTAAESAAVD